MLARWYADPDVSKYWDGRTYDEAEVVVRLHRDDVDAWIVEEDGEPVGYLQSWWEAGAPKRGGLDGFLIPSARGAGSCRPSPAGLRQTCWHAAGRR